MSTKQLFEISKQSGLSLADFGFCIPTLSDSIPISTAGTKIWLSAPEQTLFNKITALWTNFN